MLPAELRTSWDIENEVGLIDVTFFQGELTFDQLLFNRPLPGYAQYRAPLGGLYLSGSSTHPGGGVMGAPGANAAAEILCFFFSSRRRHTRLTCDWSSDVGSSDLAPVAAGSIAAREARAAVAARRGHSRPDHL